MAKTMLKLAGTTLTDIIVNKILSLRKTLLASQVEKKKQQINLHSKLWILAHCSGNNILTLFALALQ